MNKAKVHPKVQEVWDAWERGEDPLDRDLSGFIEHADWKWAIVRQPKDKTVTLRMESALLDSTKAVAKEEGVGYQGLMREFILEGIARRRSKNAFLAAERVEDHYPKPERKKKASKAPRRAKA